jgi:CheY-like chemotaxis protein
VLGAGAPQEALALARSSRIDLLISAVLMPGMPGPETFDLVRDLLAR